MCDTCGCGELDHSHPDANHDHPHTHPHPYGLEEGHSHSHEGAGTRTVRMETDVLAKNDRIAAQNRGWFEAKEIVALNLVSSPGAGKTTLLERTLRDLKGEFPWAVIEGDQQTDNDARRIAACGVPVFQINTGAACHLDAQMILDASRKLQPVNGALLMIENVGNLICPALFDLGESAKVVVASVTEGDDKPEKYPYMFRAGSLILLNKCDLLPYVPFDVERFEQLARRVNPTAPILRVSATRGDGLDRWYAWLRQRRVSHA